MILKTELKRTTILHDDVTLTVQQLSTSALTEIAIASRENGSAASMKQTFVESIVDWSGVENEAGPLECTPENRELVYEANHNFVEDVLTKINAAVELAVEVEKKI